MCSPTMELALSPDDRRIVASMLRSTTVGGGVGSPRPRPPRAGRWPVVRDHLRDAWRDGQVHRAVETPRGGGRPPRVGRSPPQWASGSPGSPRRSQDSRHDARAPAGAADALDHVPHGGADRGEPRDGRPRVAARGPAAPPAGARPREGRSGVRDEGGRRHRPVTRAADQCRRVLRR